ncbi:MAG: Type 1 glutamine amidotransferase-like domain-containing protein [Candidatus Taylorbacteria bacterium]|nr:Type 1 glutamine amidotransferase-like domain-containing protein [Candidatus Taylorbacteria bacterium]
MKNDSVKLKDSRKLLLLSSGKFLINHPQLFNKPFKDLKMAYVITASKVVTDRAYIERERAFFRAHDYDCQELDLDGKNENELKTILKNMDLVYVTGGNGFYLLKSIRESGFDKVIKKLLPEGLIYMGASAGSYVTCPTIEMAGLRHQNKYDHYGVTDLRAMALVPFLLTVHYKPEYKNLVQEKIKNIKYPLRILNDDQAILIENGKTTLVGEGKEIFLR